MRKLAHKYSVPATFGFFRPEDLVALLRQADLYVHTADVEIEAISCLEALACGLPALYFNDGGHPELVGMGGLPFGSHEEILPALDRLAANYYSFQNLITVPRLEDVAGKYLALIEDVIQ